jgi:hypothetical protein
LWFPSRQRSRDGPLSLSCESRLPGPQQHDAAEFAWRSFALKIDASTIISHARAVNFLLPQVTVKKNGELQRIFRCRGRRPGEAARDPNASAPAFYSMQTSFAPLSPHEPGPSPAPLHADRRCCVSRRGASRGGPWSRLPRCRRAQATGAPAELVGGGKRGAASRVIRRVMDICVVPWRGSEGPASPPYPLCFFPWFFCCTTCESKSFKMPVNMRCVASPGASRGLSGASYMSTGLLERNSAVDSSRTE